MYVISYIALTVKILIHNLSTFVDVKHSILLTLKLFNLYKRIFKFELVEN